jgi:hypothetical protein
VRIDLFEVFEGVIRGLITFFYSLITALVTMMCHPLRGPLRLESANLRARFNRAPLSLGGRVLRSESRQIGGISFLFLVFFLQIGLFGDLWLEGPMKFGRAIAWAPHLDSDAVWPPLLGALVSVIIIDAVLRVIARIRVPDRGIRRRLTRGGVQYGLSFGILILLISLSTLKLSMISVRRDLNLIAFMIDIPVIILGFCPAACIIWAAEGKGRSRNILIVSATAFAFWMLTAFAVAGGQAVSDFASAQQLVPRSQDPSDAG